VAAVFLEFGFVSQFRGGLYANYANQCEFLVWFGFETVLFFPGRVDLSCFCHRGTETQSHRHGLETRTKVATGLEARFTGRQDARRYKTLCQRTAACNAASVDYHVHGHFTMTAGEKDR
jgi:hypothetical protein